MNFDEFCDREMPKQNNRKRENVSSQNVKAEDIINKYGNLSQEELMQELLKEAKAGRANGELTDQKLNDLQAKLSPFLSEEQRKNLNEILKMLR